MAQIHDVTGVAAAQIVGPGGHRALKAAAGQVAGEKQARSEEVIRKLAEAIGMSNTTLSFSVDETTKEVIIQVSDAKSGELIRQIPPEEMVRIANSIRELSGIFYDHKA